MKNLFQKIAFTLTLAVTVGVNAAAVLLPLNNISTAAVSDSFNVFFVPANYVFSIWSLIYLGLIAFVVYQWTLGEFDYKIVNKILPWFIVGNLANALWLVTWHYAVFVPGLFLMLLILASLIKIVLILANPDQKALPQYFKLLVKLPFSIYLGWISVATIANATSVLDYLKFDGFGIAGQLWAGAMILIAAVLAVLAILKNKDYAYAAVIIWATTGIAMKFPAENQIVVAVVIAVIAIVVTAVYKVFSARKTT